MANILKSIKPATKADLENAKIGPLKMRLRGRPSSEEKEDIILTLAPFLLQQVLQTDSPAGLYITKGWLNQAINGFNAPSPAPSNSNFDLWEFLVCKMGLTEKDPPAGSPPGTPPIQTLVPIVYFYAGTDGTVDGVERRVPTGSPIPINDIMSPPNATIRISGGPGGGGGVTAGSTPPPTL